MASTVDRLDKLIRSTAGVSARKATLRLRCVPTREGLLQKLGPGLITGASDDDPRGIATYSQVGAQFGYGMLWTMVFISIDGCHPGNQRTCGVGRITGCGISANLRRYYFSHIDASRALFWPAVLNGVLAPPLMAVILHVVNSKKVMDRLPYPAISG